MGVAEVEVAWGSPRNRSAGTGAGAGCKATPEQRGKADESELQKNKGPTSRQSVPQRRKAKRALFSQGTGMAQQSGQRGQGAKKQKTRESGRNRYVDACARADGMTQEEAEMYHEELKDFIVCRKNRDYTALLGCW